VWSVDDAKKVRFDTVGNSSLLQASPRGARKIKVLMALSLQQIQNSLRHLYNAVRRRPPSSWSEKVIDNDVRGYDTSPRELALLPTGTWFPCSGGSAS
jgi:hypothetical protein